MMAKKKTQSLVPKAEAKLQASANLLFEEAVAKARAVKQGIVELGKTLSQLKSNDLWKHVTDKNGKQRFTQWQECGKAVLGHMATGKVYELIDSFQLTVEPTSTGEPIPPKEVQQYGIKRAVEVARLKPEQRTPEIRQMAKSEPVMAVRNKVQAILNTELPKDEQKPMLKLLAINLPEEYVREFEELIELLGHTEGARDGDSSQSIRAKAFKLMLIGAAEYWAQEIGAVIAQLKAEAAIHDSPAAEAQEVPDFPDGEVEAMPQEAHVV